MKKAKTDIENLSFLLNPKFLPFPKPRKQKDGRFLVSAQIYNPNGQPIEISITATKEDLSKLARTTSKIREMFLDYTVFEMLMNAGTAISPMPKGKQKKSAGFYMKFKAFAALLDPVLKAGFFLKKGVHRLDLINAILTKAFETEIKRYKINDDKLFGILDRHIREGNKLIKDLPGWEVSPGIVPCVTGGLPLAASGPLQPVPFFVFTIGRALLYPDELLSDKEKKIKQTIIRAYPNLKKGTLMQ